MSNPVGRPSTFTAELGEEICRRLIEGETLSRICRDDHMPHRVTVYEWTSKYPDFGNAYNGARELQADTWADECNEIADDATNDWMEEKRRDGSKFITLDREHVLRSQLRIRTRQWLAGVMKPKRYGQRLSLGGDNGAPIALNVTQTDAAL